MKARNILIVIAIILFFFNGLSYIFANVTIPESGLTNKVAYLIGRNTFFLLGLIFLLVAVFIHNRVKRKRVKQMIDSFLS